MSIRPVKRLIKSKPTLEGAGVHLRRGFGFGNTKEFDPFLLFDDFRQLADHEFQVHDLLGEGQYMWHGSRNYVELTPESLPAHILRVRRLVRTERDFDYYL